VIALVEDLDECFSLGIRHVYQAVSFNGRSGRLPYSRLVGLHDAELDKIWRIEGHELLPVDP
jgi:hypothetical protein